MIKVIGEQNLKIQLQQKTYVSIIFSFIIMKSVHYISSYHKSNTMSDNTIEQSSEAEGRKTIFERLKQLFDAYIFPGKLFPCYRSRVGKNGERLPPPTLDELLRFEADNAKGK